MSRSPNLHHSDSSLSLRTSTTRKSNQDLRSLAVENLSRKQIVDERIFDDNNSSEQEHLLSNSEIIDIGSPDFNQENWYYATSNNNNNKRKKWLPSMNCLAGFIFALIILIFFIAVTKIALNELQDIEKDKQLLYYNGSTWFDTTVIYISLDGFRNDYLERGVTPNIQLVAENGIRAQYMNPSFPSITFPNHWTLATGLYPESHGIVANEFYDPILKQEFIHKDPSISGDPKWWGGEPIWMTSTKQNKKAAVIMWPGSNVATPDYYIPYTRATTAIDKMDITLNWLDLPKQKRPQSISIYISQIDQKGHGGGPDGKQINGILTDMDNAIGHLVNGLKKRNIEKHVHLVIVSDHGMAASDKSRIIFYDDFISPESESYLRPREAWPLLGLRPKDDAPSHIIDQIYQEILAYSQTHEIHFQFYKREEMPERFHYKATERIAPIVIIPDVGYSVIRSTDYNPVTDKGRGPKGIHGYDNMAVEMRAIFAAQGPKLNQLYSPGSIVEPFFNIEMYRFLTTLLDVDPAPNNATLDGIFNVI